MSDKKVLNGMEIAAGNLEQVDGGTALSDLIHGRNTEEIDLNKLPTGGKTFTIKSAIATGEEIGPAPKTMDNSHVSGKKTGARIPRIVFADEGTLI